MPLNIINLNKILGIEITQGWKISATIEGETHYQFNVKNGNNILPFHLSRERDRNGYYRMNHHSDWVSLTGREIRQKDPLIVGMKRIMLMNMGIGV